MVTTHEVLNQATPLEDYDAASCDVALMEGVERHGGGWGLEDLGVLGRQAGDAEWILAGELANVHHPELQRYDRFGHRIDRVEYHPAYHRLIGEAVHGGLHAAPWADERPGAHVVRAARFAVWTQVEAGHGCPVSMTYSIVPALRGDPELAAEWEPRLTSRSYDASDRPAAEKSGALAGMAMTEKQGGSDVRANTTSALPVDGGYALTGHKWFCSAPMSDLFLMLAQTSPARGLRPRTPSPSGSLALAQPGSSASPGVTCFAVPRWLPDGTRNAIRIERLKDKLGNRSNASSEIELDGAWGRRLGDEGAGVPTIIRMVNHTRLDCVIGVTGQMRAGLTQAIHHTRHRAAFGRRLANQPLMQQVLADLAVESEAATATMLRLAAAYDAVAAGGGAAPDDTFSRLATAVAKYWCCKRTPMFAAEALECFGGNGYVEEGPMARLFRESPLNGIWEGSGNVIALDVLRAVGREPESLAAVLAEIDLAAGADTRFDRFVADLHAELAGLASSADPQRCARRLTERLALSLQGSLLLRHSTDAVADAFCASRLARTGGAMFGALPDGIDAAAIIERAFPA